MTTRGVDEKTPHSFELGEWLVEPSLGRISCGGRTEHLRPRVMDLLVCLAAEPGEVVSRQQLIDVVWRATFVTENVVSQAVTELRAALGDDPRSPSYIENIPRRGYRLVAEVRVVDRDAAAVPEPAPFRLVMIDREFPLPRGEIVVGRASAADIRIEHSEVSRRHARFVIDDATATVEDLGSKNGTFVNEERIHQPTALASGDTVRFGTIRTRFLLAPSPDEITRTAHTSR